MTFREKKKSKFGLVFSLIIIISVAFVGYLYLSPAFEQNKPKIDSKQDIYWNLKSKLNINLSDESGIKYYKVTYKDGQNDVVLNQEVFETIRKEITIDINPPKLDVFYKGKDTILNIEVVDNSKWNFFDGNKMIKNINIHIDSKKPVANVLSNSRYIQRGGSAVVVVKVEDDNLQDKYISFNDLHRFELIPYKEDGYYVALVAWPIFIEEFSRVNLIAIDRANNKTITKIPFYIQKKKIKIDNIKLNKRFIKNVSASVLEQSFEEIPENLEDIFVYSNTKLRDKNLKKLEKIALDSMKNENITSFNIKAFKRLRGSKTVANFAERRHYYLDDTKINEAWHLGIDWASVKGAPIRTSNNGEVIFQEYLGLYGNTIVVDHSMGLSSLYAHTSIQKVSLSDKVKANQIIANTGATGAVFGDHLHFGILIQGIEVNPIEWMDKNWIKVRITDILNKADKKIDGK